LPAAIGAGNVRRHDYAAHTALSNRPCDGGTEPREAGPVGHCGDEYLIYLFFGLCQGQVDETLAFRQIPVVHDAQQDAGYLNAACDSDHLGVDGEQDAGCQFFGEGAGSAARALSAGRPAEQCPDGPVDLLLCVQDRSC
jgi:hypothetical protein